MSADAWLFVLFGLVAVVASLLVIAQRNPVYSVLLLIASFGALSGLYVLLEAPFLAVIQIIVYAGAIMVLFLFVIMLLNAPHEETEADLARMRADVSHDLERRTGPLLFGALLAIVLAVELVWALRAGSGGEAPFPAGTARSVASIGRTLFEDFGFAFEVTSVLVLVALVGAVVLARREPASGRQTTVRDVGPSDVHRASDRD